MTRAVRLLELVEAINYRQPNSVFDAIRTTVLEWDLPKNQRTKTSYYLHTPGHCYTEVAKHIHDHGIDNKIVLLQTEDKFINHGILTDLHDNILADSFAAGRISYIPGRLYTCQMRGQSITQTFSVAAEMSTASLLA